VNSKTFDFVGWNVPARVCHDGHFPGMIQQAVLAFHIVCFLLLDDPKFLAGEEYFGRVVDMNVDTHAFFAAGDNQGTRIKRFHARHHGIAVNIPALRPPLVAIAVLPHFEFLQDRCLSRGQVSDRFIYLAAFNIPPDTLQQIDETLAARIHHSGLLQHGQLIRGIGQ